MIVCLSDKLSNSKREVKNLQVIHLLIVAAVVLFVLWLLFNAGGGLINLLWIGIVILAVLWLVGLVRGRRSTV